MLCDNFLGSRSGWAFNQASSFDHKTRMFTHSGYNYSTSNTLLPTMPFPWFNRDVGTECSLPTGSSANTLLEGSSLLSESTTSELRRKDDMSQNKKGHIRLRISAIVVHLIIFLLHIVLLYIYSHRLKHRITFPLSVNARVSTAIIVLLQVFATARIF